MNPAIARRTTWIIIALVLLVGAGAYFYFQTKAAATIGSDAPSFQADLKNTLNLQAGVGKPTFTRATTATVTDFEGLIKTAKSGEARFEGARRVENLLVNQLTSFSGWGIGTSGTGITPILTNNYAVAPDGTLSASRLQVDLGGGTSGNDGSYINEGIAPSNTSRKSVWIKSNTGSSYSVLLQYGNANSGYLVPVTPTWARVSILGDGNFMVIGLRGNVVASGESPSADILVWHPQLESITGQTNQNPSEYVSVGVLSVPYHGANVDGVKYFTTQNGNTVASNVVTEATGTAIADATLHGYVAEGARTNVALQSEDFSTTWSAVNVAVTTNTTASPTGVTTADTITNNSGLTTYCRAKESITWTTGTTYTGSYYVKAGTDSYAFSRLGDGVLDAYAVFNLSNGTVDTNSGGGTASIQAVSNGWFRISLTAVAGAANLQWAVGPGRHGDFNSSNNNSVIAWGAQLEAGANASSYIPTTTVAVTRNADALTYLTSNVSASVGSIFAETIRSGLPGGQGRVIAFLSPHTPLSIGPTSLTSYDGATRASVNNANLTAKVATWWSPSASRIFVNGTTGALGTAPSFNTSSLGIGIDSGSINAYFGTIRNVKIWKKALTDAQLTNMTSTTTAISQNAVAKTTIKATGITKMNVSQNAKQTDGLVGLWSFNGPDVSGTTASDRSGSNNNGTLTNGPVPAQGKVGQALSFDGVDDFVTLGASYNGVKTISFWIKPATTTQSILDLNGTATVDINAGTVRGNTFSTPTVYVDGTTMNIISDTNWHHIALTTNTGINASAMTLGKIASVYFAGTLDEVRLYNRALSATEVAQLYNLSKPPEDCIGKTAQDADLNIYTTVKVGTQCWLATNLKVGTRIAGASDQTNNGIIEKYCYGDTDANCVTDGGLYQWDEAMQYSTTEGARGICPAGWHIPTDAQQNALDQYLTDAGQTCDAARNGDWDCFSAGAKLQVGGSSGLNIPLAGYRDANNGSFNGRAAHTFLWSSLQSGVDAWARYVFSGYATVRRSTYSKASGLSVRCLKD